MAGRQPHPSVRRGVGVAGPLVAALGLTAVLWGLLPVGRIGHWAVHPATVAGCCWAGQLWYVSHSVGRGAGDAALGLANALTLARGGLYAVVAGFVIVPAGTDLAWVPALCYGLGVALDKLDGAVARIVGEPTALGARLDTAFDTFGFVAAPLLAVAWGQLPVWYLSISAARHVFLGGVRWRRLRGREVFDRPDSDLGRYLAGLQMVFITAALAPVVPTELVRTAAPVVLAPSLLVFCRDYLAVSGRLPGADPGA
ncbi:CDP-alcohol phosphatidyltransferase family protein [Natronomonas sp.]|uniref:CDP-alcohol phosphatidyltransferase family protein n=1 Tax=Natronomonas sp. TaxID=2184060 RepID=UPI00261DB2F6|nr:CDP-alcohol phosphatidyltransferase family protein [Natronomonas sp.]